jgi:hypothetical protein
MEKSGSGKKLPAKRNGGRTRIRTLDPLIKSQLLYQLSYAPATVLEPRVKGG